MPNGEFRIMNEPLVNVMMITYNHAHYMKASGVLQQKVSFPIELVIGEDCSTDGTGNCFRPCEKASSHHSVLRRTEMSVEAEFVRTGKTCRASILPLMRDDYWHHADKLQKQVDYLEIPGMRACILSYDIYFVKKKKKDKGLSKYRKWEMPQATVADIVETKR
jgi:hypothetical protein